MTTKTLATRHDHLARAEPGHRGSARQLRDAVVVGTRMGGKSAVPAGEQTGESAQSASRTRRADQAGLMVPMWRDDSR